MLRNKNNNMDMDRKGEENAYRFPHWIKERFKICVMKYSPFYIYTCFNPNSAINLCLSITKKYLFSLSSKRMKNKGNGSSTFSQPALYACTTYNKLNFILLPQTFYSGKLYEKNRLLRSKSFSWKIFERSVEKKNVK